MAESRQVRQHEELKRAKQKLDTCRGHLEEMAVLLAEREKAVAEREKRCERMVVEARALQRAGEARPVAASQLAALGQTRKAPAGEPRVA